MTRALALLMTSVVVFLGGAPGSAAEFNPVRRQPPTAAEPATQRLLVRLNNPSGSGLATLAQRTRVSITASRHLVAGLHALEVEPVVSGESVARTLARLRADPAVQFAEADQPRYPHALPNDPLYPGQWYLQNAPSTPSAVDAVSAWNVTTGTTGLVMADIDTGVRFDHPDLLPGGSGGRLLPGYDFISDPQIANDGDGRDADASDAGDWVSTADTSTTKFSGCTVSGSSWHGTRVAGILGALSNNAAGIAGLNWSGWILPVRALGKCGGTDSDILAAMLWAAGLHVDGVPDNLFPATIINMSLGAVGACPASYQMVINQLTAFGVLVVVSAGNEGGPVDAPANCAGVAGVAGLRHVGSKVGFSSLGPEIALSAPAGNCVNTAAGQPCLYSIDTTVNTGSTVPASNGYTDQLNPNLGTSFSAPIVAGIAGLMKAINGNLRSAQLIARLREGTTPFPTTSPTLPAPPACHVPTSATDLQQVECLCNSQTCGAGMASASGAVSAALRPIAAVALPSTVSPGQNVTLQGTGSAAACGHTLTSFTWSLVNPGASPPGISGADTATATVVAPPSGALTIRLTVTDGAGRQDSADTVVTANGATTAAPANAGSAACLPGITLNATGVVSVAVAPSSATVTAGIGTQSFVATVFNTAILPVIWQVNGVTGGNATVGTISAAGVYSPPASVPTPATVTVTALSTANSAASAKVPVTVTTAYPVTITPGSATLTAGSGNTQPFTATVANVVSAAVTWQVNGIMGGNATVGTISSTGLYSAPATAPVPATVTIRATAMADQTSSASAQVTIAAPASSAASGGSGTGANGSSGGGAMDIITLTVLLLYTILRTARSPTTLSPLSPGAAPFRWTRDRLSF